MHWETYTVDVLDEPGVVVRTESKEFFELRTMTVEVFDDGDVNVYLKGYPLTQEMRRRKGGRGDHVVSTRLETLTDEVSKSKTKKMLEEAGIK